MVGLVKKPTTVNLDYDAFKRARESGMNVSGELNECLHELTQGRRTPVAIRLQQLLRENLKLKDEIFDLKGELERLKQANRERPGPGTRQPAGLKGTPAIHSTGLPRPGPRQE